MPFDLIRVGSVGAIAMALCSCATDRSVAFFSDQGGEVVGRAPGCRSALLIPSTSQTDAIVSAVFGSDDVGRYRIDFADRAEFEKDLNRQETLPGPGAFPSRTSPCGPYSEFRFRNVDPGTYYVTTAIRVSRSGRLSDREDTLERSAEHYEIGMMRKVEILENSRQRIKLDPNDPGGATSLY